MNAAACDFPDDLLENYAMGKLSDQESEPVEEHLLLCSACQERLDDLDDFIRVMKNALTVPAPTPPGTLTLRIPFQKTKHISQCCS